MKRFISGFVLVLFISSTAIAYQASIVVPNGTGAQVRTNLNNALQAITTKQSSNSAPSTTYAYMSWVDTSQTPPVWKIRNGANTAWINIGTVNDSGSLFFATNATYAESANTANIASSADSVAWADVDNKPTTVSGYGITDIGSQSVSYATNSGTASNSVSLNGQAASYYLNGSNISTGTISASRLPTTGITSDNGAKAWATFVGNGTDGSCTISASYNISSISKSGSTYTINFTNNLTDGNYAITAIAHDDGNDVYYRAMQTTGTSSASSFQLINNGYTPSKIRVVVFR